MTMTMRPGRLGKRILAVLLLVGGLSAVGAGAGTASAAPVAPAAAAHCNNDPNHAYNYPNHCSSGYGGRDRYPDSYHPYGHAFYGNQDGGRTPRYEKPCADDSCWNTLTRGR